MRRKRLLVDVDDVLLDFASGFFSVLSRHTSRPWSLHDFVTWDIFSAIPEGSRDLVLGEVAARGWCASLQPRPGVLEALPVLRSMVDVIAVTSPFPSETWVFERTRHLQDLGFDHDHIVHTSGKHLVVGEALLEDRPSNLQRWLDHHPTGLGLLWDYPHTKTEDVGVRVASWEDVVAHVEKLVV